MNWSPSIQRPANLSQKRDRLELTNEVIGAPFLTLMLEHFSSWIERHVIEPATGVDVVPTLADEKVFKGDMVWM
jgi:hypothetical protein